jgi:hypothetical protein
MNNFGYYPQQMPQPPPSNGFISVRSEFEARNYPIAPGNSVLFVDETAPYCYTKTMGLSQLDRPVFKRFRLVEETDQPVPQPQPQPQQDEIQTLRDTCDELRRQIEWIKTELGVEEEKK